MSMLRRKKMVMLRGHSGKPCLCLNLENRTAETNWNPIRVLRCDRYRCRQLLPALFPRMLPVKPGASIDHNRALRLLPRA